LTFGGILPAGLTSDGDVHKSTWELSNIVQFAVHFKQKIAS